MPRVKKRPALAPQSASPSTGDNGLASDVLTLSEAAAYLRLSESAVQRLVTQQRLPGRQIDKEWRFLRAAIQDWLRSRPSPGSTKEAQLAVAGAWKNDPYVEEELREIYRQRGRLQVRENGMESWQKNLTNVQ